MKWKHDIKNGLLMVYGFSRPKQNFDACLTLHDEGDRFWGDGFISKVKLYRQDYINLFQYCRPLINKPLAFEIVLHTERFYKDIFEGTYDILEFKKVKTFDGYDALQITVRVKNVRT